MEKRLDEIKDKIRVYDKYLDQTDLNITEEDLSDLHWLTDKVERYEKALIYLSDCTNYMDMDFVLDHVEDVAKEALIDKV